MSEIPEVKRGEEEKSQKYVAAHQNYNGCWTPEMAKQRTQEIYRLHTLHKDFEYKNISLTIYCNICRNRVM